MKTMKIISAAVLFCTILLTQGCNENLDNNQNGTSILPERFKVDIPSSISNEQVLKSAGLKSAAYSQSDTLMGNEVYAHLNFFISVGEGAAEIVEDIIFAIALYDIDEPMSLSFTSDDDNRVKNLAVIENAEYSERSWQYALTITDAESESDADGGKALQVFWNTDPISGIAILRPYHIDRQHDVEWLDTKFRIEYSEAGTDAYEAYMMIEIAGLPMPDPRIDMYALNSMIMYVGKTGDRVDVYGNSDHPNAQFFTERTGFSWSFVASGFDDQNIAVAEVGLPPSALDESNRVVLLKEYSIKNVLTEEINEWFYDNFGIHPDSAELSAYLQNADAPGFFDGQGFLQGGVSPGEEYNELLNSIEQLSPYNPKSVHELMIEFR
jgi:hypothetical protein